MPSPIRLYLANPTHFCPICGDRLPRQLQGQNCSDCSSWSSRHFRRFRPVDPMTDAYDFIRRLGGQVFLEG
jgi:hypothetical protein